jgi:hypothetical protein
MAQALCLCGDLAGRSCGRKDAMMDERDWLAERFDEHRSHVRAVAYRMLGSLSEAAADTHGSASGSTMELVDRSRPRRAHP